MGIVHTTEVIKFVEGNDYRLFDTTIETIYYASYFQLETERLHLEIWDMENFFLNQFMSYNSIPLIDIVDGPMQQTVKMYPYTDKFEPGKLNATINMKVNLAEIWDFNLEFMDWKTTTIQNVDDRKASYNPLIKIIMDNKLAITKEVKSDKIVNSYTPYWQKVKGSIVFRGTYHELKASEIIVQLYHKPLAGFEKLLGSKIIPLKDVVDVAFAQSDMVIHTKDDSNNQIINDEDLDKPA